MVNARDDDGNLMYQVRDERTIDNVWRIPALQPASKERMGYATQKPLTLMERIISASSNPGDAVLDPFCGCATTIEAAHKLGRQWIGIDIAIHAIKRVARIRLTERLGLVEGQDFTVEGVPRTVEGAQDLWERDKYHFQKWAVEQIEGFVTTKRSADGGVDGRVYFAVPHAQELQSMVIEVKGGGQCPCGGSEGLEGRSGLRHGAYGGVDNDAPHQGHPSPQLCPIHGRGGNPGDSRDRVPQDADIERRGNTRGEAVPNAYRVGEAHVGAQDARVACLGVLAPNYFFRL